MFNCNVKSTSQAALPPSFSSQRYLAFISEILQALLENNHEHNYFFIK
jgi:hypothetical protein